MFLSAIVMMKNRRASECGWGGITSCPTQLLPFVGGVLKGHLSYRF